MRPRDRLGALVHLALDLRRGRCYLIHMTTRSALYVSTSRKLNRLANRMSRDLDLVSVDAIIAKAKPLNAIVKVLDRAFWLGDVLPQHATLRAVEEDEECTLSPELAAAIEEEFACAARARDQRERDARAEREREAHYASERAAWVAAIGASAGF